MRGPIEFGLRKSKSKEDTQLAPSFLDFQGGLQARGSSSVRLVGIRNWS